MNVPHDKVCPDCGSYMNWYKDHYECQKCGHIGRKIYRWIKVGSLILALIGLTFLFTNFVLL